MSQLASQNCEFGQKGRGGPDAARKTRGALIGAFALTLLALGAPALAQAPGDAPPPDTTQQQAPADTPPPAPAVDDAKQAPAAQPAQTQAAPPAPAPAAQQAQAPPPPSAPSVPAAPAPPAAPQDLPSAGDETRVFGAGAVMGQKVELGDRAGAVAAMAEEITVPGQVGGDVFAAGREISVAGAVDGDLRAMGERIMVSGTVSGEAALAGQDIEVTGEVGRSLHAAGQSVQLSGAARVGGDARLAGQEINVRGRVSGDVDAAGESVLIDAVIDGDANVRARRIIVGPHASIAGRLTWRAAAAPEIDPAARITGGSEGAVGDWRERRIEFSPEAMRGFGRAANVGFSLLWALSAFLIGLVFALAAPAYFDRATAALRAHPLPALGWGLLMLFAPLAVAVVLAVTLIGIPLAIIALLAYPLYLAAGYAMGAAGFGALALRAQSAGARLGALALGLAVVIALGLLPWIGGAFGFVATWLGLGLFVVAMQHQAAPPPAAAAASAA
jgi:cytoskeletal protein CcmA (bactofilin family)